MILEDFALPAEEEAEYLIAGLGRLISLRGVETFVSAPLLLSEPQFFPDPVAPRADGVAILLLRLMAYAGLEPIRVDIEIAENAPSQVGLIEQDGNPKHTAAWFIDVEDGVYHFGVIDSELRDEQGLLGILCHEVAHAYRAYHRLFVSDRDLEEKLTDLTTVYLGFGAFTLESSYQFKTGHYSATGERLLYERHVRGYLRPGQLAFLLAIQLVTRGAREPLLKRTCASLSANHAAALESAYAQLNCDRFGLLEKLDLPPEAQWPSVMRLEEALCPLPPATIHLRDTVKEQRLQTEAARVGFRVAGNSSALGVTLGAAVGFYAAITWGSASTFWPVTIGTALLGWALGRWHSAPVCSGCSHRVPKGAKHCRVCSLPLVGDIAAPIERIEAEERYHAAMAAGTRDSPDPLSETDVLCPRCGWRPTATDRWECDCGFNWNTFDTQGRCPSCERQWQETLCLTCQNWSPHQQWYARE